MLMWEVGRNIWGWQCIILWWLVVGDPDKGGRVKSLRGYNVR